MSEGIPEYVDLLRIAKLGAHYRGSILVAKMFRFVEYLANPEGQLKADIMVATDEHRHAYIEGQVSGIVWPTCQRCMRPMRYDLDTSFKTILVEFEHHLKRLDESVDAIMVSEVPASLLSIIEDELILGFSQVPTHKEGDCEAMSYLLDARHDQEQEPSTENTNPFSVLKDFKTDS